MIKLKQILAFATLIMLFAIGCKKDDTVEEVPVLAISGNLEINIANYVDNQLLKMDGTSYLNPNGDTFTVNRLKYYFTNITLKKSDGTSYKVPDSYFLIDESKPSSKILSLSGIPEGTYTGISFILGVDSARNTSGAQTGALDPGNDMFWTWSSGYIFFKLEGDSPQAISNNGNIAYHVGGYKLPYNNIRTLNLNFSNVIVKKDMTTKLFLNANINEAFKNPLLIDFKDSPFLTSAKDGGQIADNYVDMFSFDKVINP